MKLEAVLGLWQDRPPEEALATAVLADGLGYRRLWVGEMATYDAFALATAVAGRTRQIEPVVGPLAVSVRSAVAIAVGVASVASLTGRTTHVALGTSSTVVVERWHGRSRRDASSALASTARSVRTLLAGERDEATGFRLRLPRAECEIAVAAFGERAVATAAAHADRMLVNMVTPDAVGRFRATLDALGGASVPLAAWLVCAVDPGPDEIRQIRAAAVGYLSAPGYGEMFAEAGYTEVVELARSGAHPRQVLEAIPDGFERSVGLVGSAAEIGALVGRYRDAGLDTICVVPVTASGDNGAAALETMREVIAASATG